MFGTKFLMRRQDSCTTRRKKVLIVFILGALFVTDFLLYGFIQNVSANLLSNDISIATHKNGKMISKCSPYIAIMCLVIVLFFTKGKLKTWLSQFEVASTSARASEAGSHAQTPPQCGAREADVDPLPIVNSVRPQTRGTSPPGGMVQAQSGSEVEVACGRQTGTIGSGVSGASRSPDIMELRPAGSPTRADLHHSQHASAQIQQILRGGRRVANIYELKVPFCCQECQGLVVGYLDELEWVESVKIDSAFEVTVTGRMKPENCLKMAQRVYKRPAFWPKEDCS